MGGPGRGGSVWPSRKKILRIEAGKHPGPRPPFLFAACGLRVVFPFRVIYPRASLGYSADFRMCSHMPPHEGEAVPAAWRRISERGSAPAPANRAPADAAYPSRRRPTSGGREEDRNLVRARQGAASRRGDPSRAVECASRETPRPSWPGSSRSPTPSS
jgi:hypothetical protein